MTEQSVQDTAPGHSRCDAQKSSADVAILHALLGHLARQLWDVQKVRIMTSNRVGAMERDDLPVEWRHAMQAHVADLHKTERALDRQLGRLARQHFIADWILAQPGIGLPGFARLLAITGSLDNFSNVAKLWHYLGLHVVDGEAPRKRRGERVSFSPQGRVLCRQLAESIVKVGRGPHREAYDRKKEYYTTNRPDWTPARRHNAAMRYAIKELVKQMWLEWRRRRGPDGA
jgi:hypothetical protein